jgi:hypothetical protein
MIRGNAMHTMWVTLLRTVRPPSGSRNPAHAAILCLFSMLSAGAPAGEPPAITLAGATPDPAVASIARTLFADDDGRPVRSVAIDLNADGITEKFVPNEFLCGNGGCPWLIIDERNGRLIGTPFASSIVVREDVVNGYRVLEAHGSLGARDPVTDIYEFSDGTYTRRSR